MVRSSKPPVVLLAALALVHFAVARGVEPAQSPEQPKQALRYSGRSFDEWKASLTTDLDVGYRITATRAMAMFARHGYTSEAIEALVPQVHATQPISEAALQALGTIGAPAVGELTKVLKLPAFPRPAAALEALGAIGPDAAEATPEIARFLESPDGSLRRAALVALVRIGRPESVAVDAIRREVETLPTLDQQQQSIVQSTILLAMSGGGLSQGAVNDLFVDLIRRDEQATRDFAALALSRTNEATPGVIQALEQYYAARFAAKSPQFFFHPTFGEQANNAIVFTAGTAALEKRDLSKTEERNSMLTKALLRQFADWQRLARVIAIGRPDKAHLKPVPSELVVPFVVRVLEARQKNPLGDTDQVCLELLRDAGPGAAAAAAAVKQVQADADKIDHDNTRRFWNRLAADTLAAIGAGKPAE